MALQQSEQEEPLEEEVPTLSQLNNQNSVLSLTLDEFQCKSGKNFGSMNMDEFLASILSSDDNQHGSFSVPPPICKKTVDEVWSEIHKGQPQKNNEAKNLDRIERLKKQQTLGEMTLEDFLIKAGVVQASTLTSKTTSPQPRTTMPFQNQTAENCQSLQESSGSGSRKRIIDGPPEVVVERRQRRMLKNRESAARSRARKQAYTVELEAELNQLKQENDNLKKFLAEVERKRKQEISQRKNLTQAQKRTEKLRAMGKPISASW
ncbi:Basic-leucine zipper domain [Sesbania bispinosa]|nr:Basic-leucine zipper domain [Sesbania bispinosa]